MNEAGKSRDSIQRSLKRRVRETSDTDRQQGERAALRGRLKILLLLLAAAAAVLAVRYIWLRYEASRQYQKMAIRKEQTLSGGGTLFGSIPGGTVRCSVNGVTLLDEEGVPLWDYGCSMKAPALTCAGEYGLLWDRGGKSLVLFYEDGILYEVTADREISRAALSEHGMAVLLTEDSAASQVNFYDKTGRKLDIEIRNVLSESGGYPVDLALSPEGTALLLSLVTVGRSGVDSSLSFFNFEVGKNVSDRVVGVFNYEDAIFPRIEFLGGKRAVAFGSGRVDFYSLENELSPALSASVSPTGEIKNVFSGSGKAGIILDGRGEADRLMLYDGAGNLLLEQALDREYSHGAFSGDYLLLYNREECLVISSEGKVKYCGATEPTSYMAAVGKNTFLQIDGDTMREVKLK